MGGVDLDRGGGETKEHKYMNISPSLIELATPCYMCDVRRAFKEDHRGALQIPQTKRLPFYERRFKGYVVCCRGREVFQLLKEAITEAGINIEKFVTISDVPPEYSEACDCTALYYAYGKKSGEK